MSKLGMALALLAIVMVGGPVFAAIVLMFMLTSFTIIGIGAIVEMLKP